MTDVSSKVLRVLLVLLGVVNVFIGINVGLGGIQTLGLQGQVKFLEITNEHMFLVQDSHIRFFGGLYFGVGLFLILAATNLRKFAPGLKLVFALIFIGGLARLSIMRPEIILGKEIIASLIAELVGMPLLFLWLSRTGKKLT